MFDIDEDIERRVMHIISLSDDEFIVHFSNIKEEVDKGTGDERLFPALFVEFCRRFVSD